MTAITFKHKNIDSPVEVEYVFEVVKPLDQASALKCLSMNGNRVAPGVVSASAYRKAMKLAQSLRSAVC